MRVLAVVVAERVFCSFCIEIFIKMDKNFVYCAIIIRFFDFLLNFYQTQKKYGKTKKLSKKKENINKNNIKNAYFLVFYL